MQDNLVRTDLPVPVYQLLTQIDFDLLAGAEGRQPDSPTFRYYEVAGGSPVTTHEDIELIPGGVLGPDPVFLEDLWLNEMNTTGDGPVFVSHVLNALWEHMEEQVFSGAEPPAGVLMDVDGMTGMLSRDAQGNVIGGVRLPSLEAPTATYLSSNVADPNLPPILVQIGPLACFLSGSVILFNTATLDELYPNHASYVQQVIQTLNTLRAQGFILESDTNSTRQSAARSSIGR